MRAWLLGMALAAPLAAGAAEAPPAPAVPQQEAAPSTPTAAVIAPSAGSGQAPPAPVAPVQTPDLGPASIKVIAKDPRVALKAAFWPGVALHGWGHYVAGDQDTFLNLAGGELFSVVMLGFGLAEALGPDIKDENKYTSQSIALAGAVGFVGTWAWDILGAQGAARRYNARLSLGLAPPSVDGAGAQLALTTRF